MALIQLSLNDIHDEPLTHNAEVTLFQSIYKRHTNFSIDKYELNFKTPIFGNRSSISIIRFADLLQKCYLKIILDSSNCDLHGFDFIESIEIEIGGIIISRYEKDFLHIINSLYLTDEKKKMFNMLSKKNSKEHIIPLKLFFNMYEGNNIPLISLQHSEVIMHIDFAECNSTTIKSAHLDCEYVFLDTDERRRLAHMQNEYLIEQVQTHHKIIDTRYILNYKYFTRTEYFNCGNSFATERVLNDIYLKKYILSFLDTSDDLTHHIYLPFSYPCKELFWIIKPINKNIYLDLITKSQIRINGYSRIEDNSYYFTTLQQYEHHTNYIENVNLYSFSLNPEKSQPSGTINFSSIDNTSLYIQIDFEKVDCEQYEVIVYATNYNIFETNSGVGILRFVN